MLVNNYIVRSYGDCCIFQIAAFEYGEELAKEVGANLSISSLLVRDPLLAVKVYFGPTLPQHYNLLGPGAKPEAWALSHQAYNRLTRDRGMEWPLSSLIGFLLILAIIVAIIVRKALPAMYKM